MFEHSRSTQTLRELRKHLSSTEFAEPQPNRSDSRKDAKVAKYKQDCKFEARNPKFETISNGQKISKFQTNTFRIS